MNEHDRDLILGLTDGSLTGDAAESARARIAADPELASELAAQQAIRSGLTSLPEVTLTETERSGLRSALRTQLNLDDTAAPVAAPVPVRTRRFSWQPVLGLGVAAVFVAAVVILPGTLGGSSDDAADEVALAETTTTAATFTDAAGDVAEGTTLSRTTSVPEVDDIDGSDLLPDVAAAESPQDLSSTMAEEQASRSIDLSVDDIQACLEELGDRLPIGDKTPVVADRDGNRLLVYLALLRDGPDTIITIDLETCELVDVDG